MEVEKDTVAYVLQTSFGDFHTKIRCAVCDAKSRVPFIFGPTAEMKPNVILVRCKAFVEHTPV